MPALASDRTSELLTKANNRLKYFGPSSYNPYASMLNSYSTRMSSSSPGDISGVRGQIQGMISSIGSAYDDLVKRGREQDAHALADAAARFAQIGSKYGVNSMARARALTELQNKMNAAARASESSTLAQKLQAQASLLPSLLAASQSEFSQAMSYAQQQGGGLGRYYAGGGGGSMDETPSVGSAAWRQAQRDLPTHKDIYSGITKVGEGDFYPGQSPANGNVYNITTPWRDSLSKRTAPSVNTGASPVKSSISSAPVVPKPVLAPAVNPAKLGGFGGITGSSSNLQSPAMADLTKKANEQQYAQQVGALYDANDAIRRGSLTAQNKPGYGYVAAAGQNAWSKLGLPAYEEPEQKIINTSSPVQSSPVQQYDPETGEPVGSFPWGGYRKPGKSPLQTVYPKNQPKTTWVG